MGWSSALTSLAASPASTQGRSRGDSEVTEVSVRYECSEDGWVPCGSEAPLSRLFSARVVLSLARFVGSSSSVWVKSYVG